MKRRSRPYSEGPSPADEFFPPIVPSVTRPLLSDEDIREQLLEKGPWWSEKAIKIMSQIVAFSIMVGLTAAVVVLAVGGIWWMVKQLF